MQVSRNLEITDRRLFIRQQLGVSRKQSHSMAVASMNVPGFNMREIQRKRFRMSVEFGDSRQAEVNEKIVREINSLIEAHQQSCKDRPRTPPPPCNIDWSESTTNPRQNARQREDSPENYGLVRRSDDNVHATTSQQNSKRNDNFRQVERHDNFRQVGPTDNYRRVDPNDKLRGQQRRNSDRNENFSGSDRNDNFRRNERNDNFRRNERNEKSRELEQINKFRGEQRNVNFRGQQEQNTDRNDNNRRAERNDNFRRDNFRREQGRSIERSSNIRQSDRKIDRNDNFRQDERDMERNGFRQVDRDFDRNFNVRQVERNFGRTNNFLRDEPNIERNDNFSGRQRQSTERNENFRRVEQNLDRQDNFHMGQNNERMDNFRGDERNKRFRDQQRNDNFHEREQFDNNNSRFVDDRRNPVIGDFDFDQRNVDDDRFSNRETNFGLVRRQPSPENRSLNTFRGNVNARFDRNFDSRNINDNDPNDGDFRSVQRSRENTRDFLNDRYSMRSDRFNDNFDPRDSNMNDINEHFYNNAGEDDSFIRRSEFPDTFQSGPDFDDRCHGQQPENFGPPFDQDNFNRNRQCSDYNALLDNEGCLAINRRSFDNDFHDRSFENISETNNDRNQMNWNDDRRSYGSANNNRNISPHRDQVQNRLSRSQLNKNSQGPMNQARSKSNSLSRPTQTNNRGPAARVSRWNTEQPPNRASSSIATSTVVKNVPEGPATDQTLDPGTLLGKPPNKNRFLLPNPAAVARAIGQKHVAKSVNTAQPTKKQKLNSYKRGFLIGGYRLPYVNKKKMELPQPEDKSYAVTFFEQKPIYNTSILALDNEGAEIIIDTDDDTDDNSDADVAGPSGNMQPLFVGKRKRSQIRKRIDKSWKNISRWNNYSCWHTWWTAFKWCEIEMIKKLEKFGSLNLKNRFLPSYPKKSTQQIVNMVMKSAHTALKMNTPRHFRNSKVIYLIMNETFLENLPYPAMEQLQDIIRGIPNETWVYRMQSMVYLWAEYFKLASPTKGSSRDFSAIEAKWKSPVFHWLCKQSFDELKAISAVEWPEHNEVFPSLESRPIYDAKKPT